jgi:hypothetical protein
MNFLISRRSYLLSPVLSVLMLLGLDTLWAVIEPAALRAAFDNDGRSAFELMTLPLFALIIPAIWLACPFSGSLRRKAALSAAVSVVVVFAVMKQLDLHIDILSAIWPDVVANFKGTPFKMRFLTRAGIPIAAKLAVITYFAMFFGVFAALALAFSVKFVKGVFRLNPVAWTFGCFLASGAMAQVFDRLPDWYHDATGVAKNAIPASAVSLCTALEEGGEMMMALLALLAILQAHVLVRSAEPCASDWRAQ